MISLCYDLVVSGAPVLAVSVLALFVPHKLDSVGKQGSSPHPPEHRELLAWKPPFLVAK
jgi:hypothetical protein